MALAAPAPLPAAGAAPRSRVVITEELGDVLETPVGPGEAMLVRRDNVTSRFNTFGVG